MNVQKYKTVGVVVRKKKKRKESKREK